MDVSKIPAGKAPPRDINVVVKIPQGSAAEYEGDKMSGAIFVDRFLFAATAYPSAYGFIPGTHPRKFALLASGCDDQHQAGGNQPTSPQHVEIDPASPQEREIEPFMHGQRHRPGHRQHGQRVHADGRERDQQ
jgi:hypothetical protein